MRHVVYCLYAAMLCLWLNVAGVAQSTDSPDKPPAMPSAAPSKPKPDYSHQSAILEQSIVRINFENDGTGMRDSSARIRVLSEAGVKSFGVLRFPYQSSTEDLQIDYVRVRKADGTVVATPERN